jgi:hypothetical protein
LHVLISRTGLKVEVVDFTAPLDERVSFSNFVWRQNKLWNVSTHLLNAAVTNGTMRHLVDPSAAVASL